MRKLIALFLFVGSLFAGYVDELKEYLLQKEFRVTGTFYIAEGQWILGLNDGYGRVSGYFKLLGSEPTIGNPFGWKQIYEVDPQKLQPKGLFVYIDFPLDKDMARVYSWIYIDMETQKVYKLMSARNGAFSYLDVDGDGVADPIEPLFYRTKGENVVFYDCKRSYTLRDGTLRILKLSKSLGDISYRCDGEWSAENPELRNITIMEVMRGSVNDESFLGTIFKDFAKGAVSVEGVAGRRYISCSQVYAPADFEDIQTAADIERVIREWGEGSEPADGAIVDNCSFMPTKARRFDLAIEKSIELQEQNGTSKVEIYKEIQKR